MGEVRWMPDLVINGELRLLCAVGCSRRTWSFDPPKFADGPPSIWFAWWTRSAPEQAAEHELRSVARQSEARACWSTLTRPWPMPEGMIR